MLNCTWDDREAELVLRKLLLAREEQKTLRDNYLALREKYRQSQKSKAPTPLAEEVSE